MEKMVIATKRALGLKVSDFKTEEGKGSATPTPASFQGLPFDLKVTVLQYLPGISPLKSVVLASREYFTVYRHERRRILSSILLSELPPAILCDAIAVHNARHFPPKDKEGVKRFLDEYKVKRFYLPDTQSFNLYVLVPMSHIQYLVETVANEYAASIVTTSPRTGKLEDSSRTISRTETRRLYRALYRVELFCLLFARFNRYNEQSKGLPYSVANPLIFYDHEMARIFFGLSPPWQVEEIACVRNWIVEYYARALTRSKRKIDELHYKHTGSKLHPWASPPFNQVKHHDEGAERLLSLGLRFLHKATRKVNINPRIGIDLHPDLGVGQEFLTDALHGYREQQRRGRTLEMRFMSDESGPNVGWDWCRTIREHRSHHHWHVEELRHIGYVMWDHERLLGWGILEMDPDDLESDLEERRQS